MDRCLVCATTGPELIFEDPSPRSTTSIGKIIEDRNKVYLCPRCGHVQRPPLDNIAAYYDSNYKLSLGAEEEDHIHEVQGGEILYRTQFQARLVLSKNIVDETSRLLDFGCAKAATTRHLLEAIPSLDVHLYDVSRSYLDHWHRLTSSDKFAFHTLPETWHGSFDVVTAYFVFEHVIQPIDELMKIRRLLKPGGTLFLNVPCFFKNVGDFLVADHTNKFTRSSMQYLMAKAGFEITEIDDVSYRGAFCVRATPALSPSTPDMSQLSNDLRTVRDVIALWDGISSRVSEFSERTKEKRRAIYGSGFYGSYVFSALGEDHGVSCFIDQNPFLTGKTLFGVPIVHPDDLPEDIESIFVALNPSFAREAIESTTHLLARSGCEIHFPA